MVGPTNKPRELIYEQEWSPRKKSLRNIGIFFLLFMIVPLIGFGWSILELAFNDGTPFIPLMFLLGILVTLYVAIEYATKRLGKIYTDGFIACEMPLHAYLEKSELFVSYKSIKTWSCVRERDTKEILRFNLKLKNGKHIQFDCFQPDDMEFSEKLFNKLSELYPETK